MTVNTSKGTLILYMGPACCLYPDFYKNLNACVTCNYWTYHPEKQKGS